MFTKSVTLLITLGLCATSFAASCVEKLSNANKFMDVQTACIKNLHINASDIVAPDNMMEKHFHDQCLSNCTLESLNFYHNGTFKKDAILGEFKKGSPSTDVYEKLAKLVETCIEKATSKPQHDHQHDNKKAKKSNKDKEVKKMHTHEHKNKCNCRKAAKFMHCVMEKDKGLC